MPQYQQTYSVPHSATATLAALSYGTFQKLGWTVEFAVDSRLVGYTRKKWNSYYDHILIDVAEETITVTSQLPEGTSWDLFKKNKKNVNNFLGEFEVVKATATSEQLLEWSHAIAALQEQTGITLEKEEQEAAEVEAVMKLSSGSKMLTYGIIGLNTLLFIAMAVTGVHLFEPLVVDLLNWGANSKTQTTGGEWWRLLSSTFIHIGIIHLVFNMYALYMAGIYLEPMLGKGRFLAAYLCTGILASLCSTWWHGDESVSAGASGAIFGLYGVFLALLTTKLIPETMRKALLQSIVVFVIYNMAYGAKSQATDNAAHLGGFLSGLAIGYVYFFTFKNPRFRPAIAMGSMLAATLLLSFTYLSAAHNDGLLYSKKIDEVLVIQEKAMAPLSNYSSEAELLSKLATVSQVEWAKAKVIMDETAGYKLDTHYANHRKLFQEYVSLRVQHTNLSIIALQGKENVHAELDELTKKINDKVAQMEAE